MEICAKTELEFLPNNCRAAFRSNQILDIRDSYCIDL